MAGRVLRRLKQVAHGVLVLGSLASAFAFACSEPVTPKRPTPTPTSAEATPSAPTGASSSGASSTGAASAGASSTGASSGGASPTGVSATPGAARASEDARPLDVDGFLSAPIFVPNRAAPWTLLIGTHGAGGAPEWECDYWRRLSQGRLLLACLRGTPMGHGAFYYRDHHALEREFQAANAALERRFGERIAPIGVYAGFSQGATMGALMVVEHASRFRRLALVEGGYESWSPASARRFAKAGGERVLLVCGTRWCADKAETSARWLRSAGAQARTEYAAGAGHTPTGAVMAKVEQALPWLLEGLPE
ncbi:MAG: hypothetical protein QM756_07050 [Polyangiaceae bacterium]